MSVLNFICEIFFSFKSTLFTWLFDGQHLNLSQVVWSSTSRMAPNVIRTLPLLQLFNLILYKDLEQLDFSQNNKWVESDEMQVSFL